MCKRAIHLQISIELYSKDIARYLGTAFQYIRVDKELHESVEKIRLTMRN